MNNLSIFTKGICGAAILYTSCKALEFLTSEGTPVYIKVGGTALATLGLGIVLISNLTRISRSVFPPSASIQRQEATSNLLSNSDFKNADKKTTNKVIKTFPQPKEIDTEPFEHDDSSFDIDILVERIRPHLLSKQKYYGSLGCYLPDHMEAVIADWLESTFNNCQVFFDHDQSGKEMPFIEVILPTPTSDKKSTNITNIFAQSKKIDAASVENDSILDLTSLIQTISSSLQSKRKYYGSVGRHISKDEEKLLVKKIKEIFNGCHVFFRTQSGNEIPFIDVRLSYRRFL